MARRNKAAREFGTRVRRLRTNAGMTLAEVADAAQISITYLSKIERGELPPPSEKKVKRIARAVGADAGELLRASNRLPADALRIFQRHPAQYAQLLRATRHMNRDELDDLLDMIDERFGTGGGRPIRVL